MDASFLTPKARCAADGEGWGCRALEPIATGETVAAFGGRCVTSVEFDHLSVNERRRSIQIDDALYMVGEPSGRQRLFIGHSCAPNCGMSGGVILVARRDIAVGEMLTFDYAMTNGSDFNEFECNCGASTCRHKVTGSDWMIPELQLAYRGSFSPYLTKRIASLVSTGSRRRAFAL